MFYLLTQVFCVKYAALWAHIICCLLGGGACRGYSPTKASGYRARESAAVGGRTATRCGHVTDRLGWDIQRISCSDYDFLLTFI